MYSDLVLANRSCLLDAVQFYCVLCHVSLTSKSAWISHVNGHHHGVSTLRIAATHYRGANSVEELIDKTIHLLGSQIKFVVRVGEKNIFKFQCLLCLIELNGYFAVTEHLDDCNHRLLVDRLNFSDISSAMPDEDRELPSMEFSKTVKLLCNLYSGSLTCNRCSRKVELDEEMIIDHEDLYHSSSPSSTVERFRVFSEADLNPIDKGAYQKPSLDTLRTRIESMQLNSSELTVSRFRCLNCDISGSIDEWKPHLLSQHANYWDLQFLDTLKNDFEDENSEIFCVCLLCECVFFGQRKTIAQHPHFGENRLPNDFPPVKATPFTRFLSKLHCYRIQCGTNSTYVAYCDVCKYFSFEELEEHFVSLEHRLNTNVAGDWYDCRICRVFFFGERRSYDVHKLWPMHICATHEDKTSKREITTRQVHHDVEINDETRWMETNEHIELMKRLQKRIEGEFGNSYQFLNNFQQFAYFCGVCDITEDSKENWSNHLRDKMHEANAIRAAKPFESTCVSCKLCIFGGIGCHVGHSMTKRHKAIKQSVLVFWNEERVQSRTELTENYRTDQRLSDMLYKILNLQSRSASPPCNSEVLEPCAVSLINESETTMQKSTQPVIDKEMPELSAPKLQAHQSTIGKTCKNFPKDNSAVQKPQLIIGKPTSSLSTSSEPKIVSTSVEQKCSQSTVKQIEEQLSSGVYSCKIDIHDDLTTMRETIRVFLLKSEDKCQSDHLKRFHCSFCLKYYGKIDSWYRHLAEPKHLKVVKNYFKGNAKPMATIFHCTGCDTITLGTIKSDHDYRKCSQLVRGKRRSVSRTSEERSSTRSLSSSSNEVKTSLMDEAETTDSILSCEPKIQLRTIEQPTEPSSGNIYSCIINICDDPAKIHNLINYFIRKSEKRRRKPCFKRLHCSFCNKSYGAVESWRKHLADKVHIEVVEKCLEEDPEAFAAIIHCNECDALSFCQDTSQCHHKTCPQWVPKSTSMTKISKTNEDDCSTRSLSSSPSLSNESKTDVVDETEAIHRVGSDCVLDVMSSNDGEEDLDETMKNEELSEDVSSISDESEDERNKIEEERVNGDAKFKYVEYLIVVRGIPADNLKNKKLIQNTFRKYGNVNRTYVKKNISDTLFIVVIDEPKEMLQNLRDNIEELKIKLNAEELIIGNKIKNNDGPGTRDYLSEKAEMLFSNRRELNNAIMFLIKKYHEELINPKSTERIHNLVTELQDMAIDMYDRQIYIKAYVFGSRLTGLASENSDVDIYLQIANSFRGATCDSSNLQRELVLYFASKMRTLPHIFSNVTSISLARVPIVRFTHVQSNLYCDLSFKSGLSTMNSVLVRIYLELDERVKALVCGVKLWMKLNEIASSSLFTTYAQIWIVLFFLMQPEICVVPTVIALRRMLPSTNQELLIEGWNCAFPKAKNIVWRSECQTSADELLCKFFEFYSNENLDKYVLCTMTGMKMEKKYFIQLYENLPKMCFGQFTACMKYDRVVRHRILNDFEGLCVQDPFDHAHNVTKTINGHKYKCFVELCRKTVAILKK